MAGAISVSRNSVIGRRNFSVLDSMYKQMAINHHFDLNSCSHGVKTEVKTVDANNSWLYDQNQ